MAPLVCEFNASICGENPSPAKAGDSEYDQKFGRNYMVARNKSVGFVTTDNFVTNEYCTYVIAKDHSKQGLVLNLTRVTQSSVMVFRANRTFLDAKNSNQSWTITTATAFQWESFGDTELIFILVKANHRSLSTFMFEAYSQYDKPSNTSNNNNTEPITVSSSKSSFNSALIVGITVGLAGFAAVAGFLVYYIRKQRKMRN